VLGPNCSAWIINHYTPIQKEIKYLLPHIPAGINPRWMPAHASPERESKAAIVSNEISKYNSGVFLVKSVFNEFRIGGW